MSDKTIKSAEWTVKELLSKIFSKKITKPKFQRKKKWDILPKKDNVPNEKDFIDFLSKTQNSVHPITFGQYNDGIQKCFANIDGNNRINAICHYIDKPFDIFPNKLDNLNIFIDNISSLDEDDKKKIKNIFKKLKYNEIINFRYNKYFIRHGEEVFYNNKLKILRDDFEPHIENTQTSLKINGEDHFDLIVKINVNLFEGYNTDELCQTFEDINKYNTKLTETELLACRLFNECNFEINDRTFKSQIQQEIKEYYKEKASGEVIECFVYNTEKDDMNAHDFIISFQNLFSKKYPFIEKADINGLSLYFKLFKNLYGGFMGTFTSKNVNDFIEKITYSCDILKDVTDSIFPKKINEKLFNNTCRKKIKTLKKNNLYMLICSIVGFHNQKTPNNIIKNELEKCLLFHFFTSDLKNKDKREIFKNFDSITYIVGGGFIVNVTKKLLSNPKNISNKLTKELFHDIIDMLYSEANSPHERRLPTGKNKNKNRRKLKFFEKALMFYFYKGKIPINMLTNNTFSIEHICPNSSDWVGEMDKDRTGNLFPIIDKMNSARGNKHINCYKNHKFAPEFCKFIQNIIPNDVEYDMIMKHERRKPKVIDIQKYNEMCIRNEKTLKENLITDLFSV